MKKKTLFFFVVLITIIGTASVAFGQVDFTLDNTYRNIGKSYETQTNGSSGDICPFGANDNQTFFGGYFGEFHTKFKESDITNGVENSFRMGLSVVSLTDNNLFFKMHIGLSRTVVRYEKFYQDFNDYQENFGFNAGAWFGYYRPEANFFSCTMITLEGDQPMTTKKRWYYDDKFVTKDDSFVSNLQFISVKLEQTMYRFSLSKDDSWFLNFNLSTGYVLEHPIINLNGNPNYFALGGSISVGSDYFSQDLVKISVVNRFNGFNCGPELRVDVDLISVFGLCWPKDCEEE